MTPTARCAGVEQMKGGKLRQTFLTVGLLEPRLRLEAHIGSEPDYNGYNEVISVVRILLPLSARSEIATAAEVDIGKIEGRMHKEDLWYERTSVTRLSTSPGAVGAQRRS